MDRQTFKNAVVVAKIELKDAVAHKIAMTRERVEYKLKTRGNTPETERLAWFRNIDYKRDSTRYSIRHLHLAYGYLRGQDYKRMEPHTKTKPCAAVIAGILERWLRENPEHCDETTIRSWLSGTPSQLVRPTKPVVEEVAA